MIEDEKIHEMKNMKEMIVFDHMYDYLINIRNEFVV
jgi:hypothetical protein